jgi:hypothetical protein
MKVAGIDVAHKTLALAIRAGEKTGKVQEFTNTAAGHGALIKVLKGAGVERVCLEATGSYHLDLALALEAAGVALMVVNPKAAKRFAEALMTRYPRPMQSMPRCWRSLPNACPSSRGSARMTRRWGCVRAPGA